LECELLPAEGGGGGVKAEAAERRRGSTREESCCSWDSTCGDVSTVARSTATSTSTSAQLAATRLHTKKTMDVVSDVPAE
jgi:hypothetical protein